MENPFLKRATERVRDDEAFLAIVTPQPVTTFLKQYGETGELYEPLVVVRGAPGSGKTTLARVFQYRSIATLLRNRTHTGYKQMLSALADCNAVVDGVPRVLACRLPMEANYYRDLWEFPYPEELKTNLLTSMVQARAVLAWARELDLAGVPLTHTVIRPREDAEAALDVIGGESLARLRDRAREVERALYEVVSALVAPPVAELPAAATAAYRPLDVIEEISIPFDDVEGGRISLKPLVILDDVHALHPAQFLGLQRWMMRRELRVARWMLMRLDILTPPEVLAMRSDDAPGRNELPGPGRRRDLITIWLQSSLQDRTRNRTGFRTMAKEMAERYLRQMPVFRSRELTQLDRLLATAEPPFGKSHLRELQRNVDAAQKKCHIAPTRRIALETQIDAYARKTRDGTMPAEVRLATLRILMHRYQKRVPQASLFGPEVDLEPSKPLKVKPDVIHGARLHLMYEYGRPYYFGADTLCDASSENAEQFLHLAAQLVDQSATQLTRGRGAMVSAADQHEVLQKRARDLVTQWSFPHSDRVRRLTDAMAVRCRAASHVRNARLGAGANAFGILMRDFEPLTRKEPLARVLQFGIAYNAITLVPNYLCQDEYWCLLELGGLVCLSKGLTLKRGGFVRSSVEELDRMLSESLVVAGALEGDSGETKEANANLDDIFVQDDVIEDDDETDELEDS